MIKLFFILLSVLAVATCTLGVISDVSDSPTATAFPCIVKGGYSSVSIMVSSNPTQIMVDSTGLQNINKAKNSFTKVFLSFSSCRGRDPIKQVDEFAKKISKDLYDTVWVYLGQQSLWYQCSPTGYTNQQNCDYLHQIVSQFQKYQIKVGIASDLQKWSEQLGSSCSDLGNYPLYWTPKQDNNPSFSNFKGFGGWKTPAVKVYKWSQTVCGANVDLFYHP